jgi:hypothetical protein
VNSREAIQALIGAKFTPYEINENPSYYSSCPALVLGVLNCPDLARKRVSSFMSLLQSTNGMTCRMINKKVIMNNEEGEI